MMCDNESKELSSKVLMRNNHIYVPAQAVEEGLFYIYTWDVNTNTAAFANTRPDDKDTLPAIFSILLLLSLSWRLRSKELIVICLKHTIVYLSVCIRFTAKIALCIRIRGNHKCRP